MADTKWSNLATAPPLCRHAIEDTLVPQEDRFGGKEFAAFIRKQFASLYEPGATCHHTEVVDE